VEPFDPDRDMRVFDLETARRGMRLNRLAHRLREPELRAAFHADPAAFLAASDLTEEERAAVAARDWRALQRLGMSVYAVAKLGSALGVPLPEIVKAERR
jgi:protocatechuate 4,5-dioxygenase alpha subunit